MIIQSNIDKNKTLFVLYRQGESLSNRLNLTDETEALQVSIIKLNKLVAIRPHMHLKLAKKTEEVQECWVVIKGNISVNLMDIDKTYIQSESLNTGDIFLTLGGYHSMQILEDAEIVEIKNGPYIGKDIQYIGDL